MAVFEIVVHRNVDNLIQLLAGVSVDQSKPCVQIYMQKNACCINLQLPILFFVNSIISDMHHRITYMYLNFQQNWVSRSVKIVHTNIFAKNRKLHKFSTTNSNLEKIDYSRYASSIVCVL